MDLRDTPEEAAFRSEVRAWLEANAPDDLPELTSPAALRDLEDVGDAKAWSAKLAGAGYAGLTWPVEFGGRGAPLSYQAIYLEEAAAVAGAGPPRRDRARDDRADDHRARHARAEGAVPGEDPHRRGGLVPGLLRARRRLRPRRRAHPRRAGGGDVFVVNGQKVWSSFAQIADWAMLIVRTDPESERHEGLTMLLVDMRSPGVDVRPIKELTGDSVFNEVFYGDVDVPVENVLGEVGAGLVGRDDHAPARACDARLLARGRARGAAPSGGRAGALAWARRTGGSPTCSRARRSRSRR